MKRLYAFKNIQQLMASGSKAAHSRAKELAMENNFVTDLTSLVIPNDREGGVKVANLGSTASQHQLRGSQPIAQTTSLVFSPPRSWSSRGRTSMMNSPTLSAGVGRMRGRGGGWRGVSNSTVTSPDDHQNCSITLYDKEYHSGQSLVVTRSIPDLSLHNFEDKLVSVKVEGNCRWKIFSGED